MAVKLKLPAGLYKNSTAYAAAGRWYDSNLVRWINNIATTMNGWKRRYNTTTDLVIPPLFADPSVETCLSGYVVEKLNSDVITYFGSNIAIYEISDAGAVTNRTPAGWVDPNAGESTFVGYGMWLFGMEDFGTARPTGAQRDAAAFSWAFDSWGELPVACARGIPNEPLYILLNGDPLFTPIANSPVGAHDVVVTNERIMMAVGDDTDSRLVRWTDMEDYTDWTPTITNLADTRRLAGTGSLLACVNVLGQVLILGDNDAFIASFIGPPYVYDISQLGRNCGLLAHNAVAVTSSFAMWFSGEAFWMYDGSLKQVECEVEAFILKDMDPQRVSMISAFTVAAYNEVWWLYPSNDSDENNRYVIFNYRLNIWYCGKISRTCGIDASPARYVAMIGQTGFVYDHEVPNSGYGGFVPYLTSGPLELANGESLFGISHVIPDDHPDGRIKMTLEVHDMPKQAMLYSRDFTLTSPTSTTGIMGRDIRIKLESISGQPWALGMIRVDPVIGETPRR